MKSKVYKQGDDIHHWIPVVENVENAIQCHCLGMTGYESLLIVFTDDRGVMYSIQINSRSEMNKISEMIIEGLTKHLRESLS